jgi:hypothetical protein
MERLFKITSKAKQHVIWLAGRLVGVWWAIVFAGRGRFKYNSESPLGVTKIRLMRIPPDQRFSRPLMTLKVELETFDLAELPPYLALSYTWGPAEPGGKESFDPWEMRPIAISSSRFDIYPNLFHALSQLERSKVVGWIWADAVCINQEDVAERNAQVSIMDIIYKNASKTVMWLGKERAATSKAAQLLASVADMAKQAALQISESEMLGEPMDVKDPNAFDRYGMPALTLDDWYTLADIYGRRYFGRLWMVQELALSRQVEVMCGKATIEWYHIGIFASLLLNSNWLNSVFLTYPLGKAPTSISRIHLGAANAAGLYIIRLWVTGEDSTLVAAIDRYNWAAHLDDSSENLGVVMLRLFEATKGFTSTDVRDRIFSFYGVLKQISLSNGREPVDWYFKPDYRLNEKEVFSRFCQGLITETKSLDVLMFAGEYISRRVEGLPSWVPEFTANHSFMIQNLTLSQGSAKVDVGGTSGAGKFFASFDGARIAVNGSEIGKVAQIGETWIDYYKNKALTGTFLALYGQVEPIYQFTNQPRSEVLWRTLAMDQDRSGHRPAPDAIGKAFRDWITLVIFNRLSNLIKVGLTGTEVNQLNAIVSILAKQESPVGLFLPTWQETRDDLIRCGWMAPGIGTAPGKLPDAQEYLNKWGKSSRKFESITLFTMTYRRTFATDIGHFGSGPQGLQLGDSVWAIAGCSVPLILRKISEDDQDYRLIGEAYVHGVMNGEAVSEDSEWKQICLC